jgi:hypothetical protein
LSHELQARHNENLATQLLNAAQFNDWVCTTSFYSALHFFEAYLAAHPGQCTHPLSHSTIVHTENSVPRDYTGKQMYSVHTWRELLIKRNFPRAFKDYRNLIESSKMARYHANAPLANCTAHDFFPTPVARQLLLSRLQTFKTELGF